MVSVVGYGQHINNIGLIIHQRKKEYLIVSMHSMIIWAKHFSKQKVLKVSSGKE